MRYAYLDGLRGLAILGVIATHVGQVVHGLPTLISQNMIWGIRGVHLFFIVSALTLLLVTKPETLDVKRFAIRRFFRIAPMFYLAATFYTLAAYTGWLVPEGGAPSAFDVTLTFAFLHGFNPAGINNVVPGGWSIACEAIFYAILVSILPYARSFKGGLVITASSIALTAAALYTRYLTNSLFHYQEVQEFFHFNFLVNSLPFALGILIFSLIKHHGENEILLRYSTACQIALATLIILFGGIAPGSIVMETPFATLLGAFTFFIAINPPAIIASKALVRLGELSFSIYLIHFTVIHLITMAYSPLDGGFTYLVTLFLLTLLGSGLLANLCHHFIERPFINLSRRITTNDDNRSQVHSGSTSK